MSSVRRGLENERRSLGGLISQLGHTALLFEDFSARDVPSREACIRGLQQADAYLLILGPNYGNTLPETGQSPTHEEWAVATDRGIPRLVYRKLGVEFEDAQQNFYREIAQYGTGVFHDDFHDTGELLVKVAGKVREMSETPGALEYAQIDGEAPKTAWRSEFLRGDSLTSNSSTSMLELHVINANSAPPTRRELRMVGESLAGRVRQARLVDDSTPLSTQQIDGAYSVDIPGAQRNAFSPNPGETRGIRLDPSGQVSIWGSLPSNGIGSLFDPAEMTAQISSFLRGVGRLNIVTDPYLAISVAVEPTEMITFGRYGQNTDSATFHRSGRSRQARLAPDELVSNAALSTGATEVAENLTAGLRDALSA